MKQKVILITGASSGIGYDTATRLAKQGHKVYGAARRIDKMQPLKELGVTPIKMDVTDDASMIAGVNAVMEAEGRIDVLVNNAGYGYFGAIENVSMEEARKQLEVNVFGLARLTQLVIPHMRQQGSGRIVNLASIAGKLALYFGGWYHVSKFAVEGFSDALRMELKPFGIDVVIIEPGGIRTEWGVIAADHLAESSKGTVYEQAALNEANAMKYTYTRAKLLSNPSVIAKAICKGVNKRHPKARYRTGMGSHSLVFLHWLLPSKWWDGLMRSLGKVRVER
ncbi:MAG: oxidoreductase [Bacteroidales bacterium]|jgi:NAD(P)-dependent dehydrogenase (short-subunit alcohol dehydrogenase family)|nr:oxidoreductase [Bacteroidales bacterium]